MAGDPFTLDCAATGDSKSPNKLRVRWFKDSNRIDNNYQWRLNFNNFNTEGKHTVTVRSIMIIFELNVDQHNGTYTCSVDNFMIGAAVNQSTTLIVEST